MTLKYILDTDICIYIAKHQPPSVHQKFKRLKVGSVGMSVVTYGELRFGANKSQHSEKAHQMIDELSRLIKPLEMPTPVSDFYGEIRHYLQKKGKPIGGNDLWIAAHARAMGLVLVTNNVSEFSRVPSLKVENWVRGPVLPA